MNHPKMSSTGRRWAALIGLVVVFMLPKHVECGYPGRECSYDGAFHHRCSSYELEPYGFYLIELVADRDVGFAYSSGEDCR